MSWAKFFSMGGYAFYVWGSYLTALIVMGGEVLLVRRRTMSAEGEGRRDLISLTAALSCSGLLLGMLVGYLIRPTPEIERLTHTLLESSMNYVMAGGIVGAAIGAVIGYFIAAKRQPELRRSPGESDYENQA